MKTLVLSLMTMFMAIGLISSCKNQDENNARPPDILFILADDLGIETLNLYGGSSYPTPHLDQMAREGVLLKHIYSMPLCTPSRVQFLTGKYNDETYRGFGILDPSLPTLPQYLKDAGYETCVLGKWQLYGNRRQRDLAGQGGSTPGQAGFDYSFVWQVDTLGSRYYHPTITENGVTRTWPDAYGPALFRTRLDSLLRHPSGKPRFYFYSMALTHEPFYPAPSEFSGDTDTLTPHPEYFSSMMAELDRGIGEILDWIRSKPTPTMVIFTGDNGTDQQVVSECNGESVRGGKGLTLDRGTHVPGIIWYPGVLSGNSVYEYLIDFTDLMPTFLDVAGAAQATYDGPGISFWPVLTGKSEHARQAIYCAYDPQWGSWQAATYVQDRTWKLYTDGRFYHLPTDPEELQPIEESGLDSMILVRKAALQALLEQHGYRQ